MSEIVGVIGIDIGSTTTDVVFKLGKEGKVIFAQKIPTVPDFTCCVIEAIKVVFKEFPNCQVNAIMIGTTLLLNALLESSPLLGRVDVIRICGPLTRDYPPFSEFPVELANRIRGNVFYLNGGFEYNYMPVTKFNEQEVISLAEKLIEKFKKTGEPINVAICGVHAPLFPEQENTVEEILKQQFSQSNISHFYITKSHEIGPCGFLSRENSTIMNACLLNMSKTSIENLQDTIIKFNSSKIEKNIYLIKNDGTLYSLEEAIRLPVFTINCGPVNSVRGGYHLTHLKNAIVVDIGGTSLDVAVLRNGFPLMSSTTMYIGGVPTNFSIPQTVSIALGGGSIISIDRINRTCKIGPESIGYRLLTDAKCFGGNTLVLTDIAVKKGIIKIPGAKAELVDVTEEDIEIVYKEVKEMLQRVIDQVITSSEPLILILTGGGSDLIPEDIKLSGISKTIKPDYYQSATAVGASLAQISEILTKLVNTDDETKVKNLMREEGKQLLISKGAIPDSIEVFVETLHLSYTIQNAKFKLTAKSIGDLDSEIWKDSKLDPMFVKNISSYTPKTFERIKPNQAKIISSIKTNTLDKISIERPNIIINQNGFKEWILTPSDIERICIGAALLGCGGGGSPDMGKKFALDLLSQLGKQIKIVSLESLPEDSYVVWSACFGAPSVTPERLGRPNKVYESITALQEYLKNSNKKISALISPEIGGMNSIISFLAAAHLNLPVVDGDYMGRAFPEFQMIIPCIYGATPVPVALADDLDYQLLITKVQDNSPRHTEGIIRHNIERMGCEACGAGTPLIKSDVKKWMVKSSISHCWNIGNSIIQAKIQRQNIFEILPQQMNGKLIFVGKIIDSRRLTVSGFNKGSIIIAGQVEAYRGHFYEIYFQNELVVAYEIMDKDPFKENASKKSLACVPDLITLLDTETFLPIVTDDLRYGLTVAALAIPCPDQLSSPQGLSVVGPACFGLPDVSYSPVGKYVPPLSYVD